MSPKKDERREFFRITDRLLVEYREIGYEQSLILERNLHHADFSPFLPDILHQLAPNLAPGSAQISPDLYSYLEMLDRKLNTIIDLLTRKDDLFQSKYVEVTISGAGMKYRSDTKMNEGAYLELRIVLPFIPNPRIAAIGKVVRCKPCRDGDGDSWETAISFVAINEKDRDVLISYIFSKEREYLRAQQKP
jgi:hypothetical protein